MAEVTLGMQLPELVKPPISRATLDLFAGSSHDHVPLHIDSDFAKAAGMGDVFAHGMLSMAWLARVLTNWVPQSAIRAYSVRFAAITQVAETITCAGVVTEKFEVDGERRVRLSLTTANAEGQVKLAGDAVVAWP